MGRDRGAFALRRCLAGAVAGVVSMALFVALDLFEGPKAARRFGVECGALFVAHLALAVLGRYVAVGMRDLRWLRSQGWRETDAGLWASQFLVGVSATVLPAAWAILPASKGSEVAAIVAAITFAAWVVSGRRRRVEAYATLQASWSGEGRRRGGTPR